MEQVIGCKFSMCPLTEQGGWEKSGTLVKERSHQGWVGLVLECCMAKTTWLRTTCYSGDLEDSGKSCCYNKHKIFKNVLNLLKSKYDEVSVANARKSFPHYTSFPISDPLPRTCEGTSALQENSQLAPTVLCCLTPTAKETGCLEITQAANRTRKVDTVKAFHAKVAFRQHFLGSLVYIQISNMAHLYISSYMQTQGDPWLHDGGDLGSTDGHWPMKKLRDADRFPKTQGKIPTCSSAWCFSGDINSVGMKGFRVEFCWWFNDALSVSYSRWETWAHGPCSNPTKQCFYRDLSDKSNPGLLFKIHKRPEKGKIWASLGSSLLFFPPCGGWKWILVNYRSNNIHQEAEKHLLAPNWYY